jgi:hypothetical protein
MRRVSLAVCAAVMAAGLYWGTFAVGGSDSYCYVHQAQGWSSGRLQDVEPLALEAPWPAASLTFAPAGHVPSPTVPGASVPICPAGLSIAMAPFMLISSSPSSPSSPSRPSRLIFLVVPLFGALLVWSVYVLGSRYAPRVGLASAAIVACSPAFLFQLVQPMSDVPAAALWLLAAGCATGARPRSPLAAGLATSAAILVRPNLLPLGFTLGVFILARPERAWRERMRDAAIFAAASAPGCVAVAIIQQMFYGSPLESGYGPLDSLFTPANVAANASRYLTWMWQTHTPAWLLALAAPFLLPGWLTSLLFALAFVDTACYLPYMVFNDWWYLRFLLPAIAIVLILTVAAVDASVRRMARRKAAPYGATSLILVVFTAALCVFFVREARARSVFDLHRLESRYERAGTYVANRLPPNAIIITSWESGSLRFYANRKTLVWDALDPAWLDRAIAYVRARGYEPYLLFERWEEPLFRRRFGGRGIAALDWPPDAEIAGQVRIYRPEGRERYLRGEGVSTEYAR